MPDEAQGNTEPTPAPTPTPSNEPAGTPPVEGSTKPPEGQPPAGQQTTEGPKSEAPESYADFSTPDGVEVNAELTGEFKTIAKELGLSQANAQKVFDLGVKQLNAETAAREESWNKTREEWQTAVKNDPEIGGAVFDASIAKAKRVLASFGSEELVSFLDETGYGDNPHLIKMLVKLDDATGEKPSADGTPAPGSKSAAEVMFPNQGK